MTFSKRRGASIKRAYYDDPLAAAWMAKHFGMKLQVIPSKDQIEEYDLKEGEVWDWMETAPEGRADVNYIEEAIQYLYEATDRLYVHPDSLPLLQPQEGDILDFGISKKWEEDRFHVCYSD